MRLPEAVLLATRNEKKRSEMGAILQELGLDAQLLTLDDVAPYAEPVESGASFLENATIKAQAGVAHTGIATLADDSGLCVQALNGMPGVLSARWAGKHGGDAQNLQLVLDQLRDVPDDRRGAAFVAAVVLAVPEGELHSAEGRLEGQLLRVPRGTGGFGYDPIFLPDDYRVTTAQMAPSEKNAISHRSRALRALLIAL